MARIVSHAYSGERSIWLNALQSPRARKIIALGGVAAVIFYIASSIIAPPPAQETKQQRGERAVWTPPPAFTSAPLGKAEWKPAWTLKRNAPSQRTVTGSFEALVPYLDQRWDIAPVFADVKDKPRTLRDGSTFPPHLWLTVADAQTIDGSTAALGLFVDELNAERVMREGARARQTVVIVLCADGECLSSCEDRRLWCYGGPQLVARKPAAIPTEEWIKLHALIRVLETRDAFYVSPAVAFKTDPYPTLQPPMETNDFLALEDDYDDGINSNLIWVRRGEAAVNVWKRVLEQELDGQQQERARLNYLLGASRLRRSHDADTPGRRREWLSPQGLRMHVLSPDQFYNIRFQHQALAVSRAKALSLDSSCGGDPFTNGYIAKSLGFWANVDSYYSLPPKTITIGHLGGTKADVLLLMKILLAAGHYAQRAVELPPTVVIRDLPAGLAQVMPIYAAFPLGQLEQSLSVRVLEPGYSREHAPQWLIGRSVDERAGLAQSLDQGWHAKAAREAKVVQLLEQDAVLDMRHTPTFEAFVRHLLLPSFKERQAIRLHNFDWPGPGQTFFHWREWNLPRIVEQLDFCGGLGQPIECGRVCPPSGRRWADEEEWPTTDDVVSEQWR